MAENKLEPFQALGMIVLPERAVAIGAIAMIEPHPSGAVTLTLVSGKTTLLEEAEAKDFFKQVSDFVMQARYAAAQTQPGPRRIITH